MAPKLSSPNRHVASKSCAICVTSAALAGAFVSSHPRAGAAPNTLARDKLTLQSEGPFEERCFSCAKSFLFEVAVTPLSTIGNGAC